MKRIVAVTSSPTGVAHTSMAAAALRKTAEQMGQQIKVETPGIQDRHDVLSPEDIARADVVLLATDIPLDVDRFAGKPIHQVRTSDAIRNTKAVIEAALGELPAAQETEETEKEPQLEIGSAIKPTGKRLVGITSCPTGIAHTFMAAEALQKAAKALGHTIRIETQGSVGAKNQLTDEEVAEADAVVIAAETKVDLSRFAGKPLYATSTKQAIHAGQQVIESALSAPIVASEQANAAAKLTSKKARTGPYRHLMTGVSYMLPVVIAGGLAIALAFALGGIYAGEHKGTVAWALNQIGAGTAFHLFVAVLSGFIAFSIADRPGLAPGLIGGLLAQNLGAGFLGGIASGFLAGYLTKFLTEKIRLPANLEGLKPVLILPFLSTLTVGLLMIYVIAPPVQGLNDAMNAWLNGMRGANAALLGIILGGMMAFDMGGPINKAAYTFAVGLLASKVYTPMAAVMAAGMTPALGVALAVLLFKNRFDSDERKAAGPALVLGFSFITEGAIPFAAKDPLRVIPALILGSATAGAVSMAAGVQLLVPHGGIFAALIPGAVTHLVWYLVAIVSGAMVTAGALFVLKRPFTSPDELQTGTKALAAA